MCWVAESFLFLHVFRNLDPSSFTFSWVLAFCIFQSHKQDDYGEYDPMKTNLNYKYIWHNRWYIISIYITDMVYWSFEYSISLYPQSGGWWLTITPSTDQNHHPLLHHTISPPASDTMPKQRSVYSSSRHLQIPTGSRPADSIRPGTLQSCHCWRFTAAWHRYATLPYRPPRTVTAVYLFLQSRPRQ
jgi:hypothetical protein